MDDETARELRALRKLWAWTLEHYHEDGGDIDGWDLLTEAEVWGLVKLVPYRPAEHGELDAEPGDPIYRPTGLARNADQDEMVRARLDRIRAGLEGGDD